MTPEHFNTKWQTKWAILFLIMVLFGCQSLNKLAPEKITEQGDWYANATWSPNGESVIYKTGIEEQFEILDLTSGNEQGVPIPMNASDRVIGVEWINETQIVYVVVSRDENKTDYHLMLFDLATNEEQEILSFQGHIYDFCWNRATNSPVVVGTEKSYFNDLLYGDEVFVYDEESEDWSVIYEANLPNYSDGIGNLSCHPYEDQIAFVEVIDDPDTHDKEYNLYILSENYQNQQLILEKPEKGRFSSPTWSPDGQWIAVHAYSDQQGRRQGITIVPTDDTASRQDETIWLLFSGEIIWSPVDNVLLLRSGSSLGGFSLYRFDLSPWVDETS